MASLALRLADWLAIDEAHDTPAPARPRVHDPPLIGDIVTSRAGVAEHLIQWRRAEGEDDPDPQDL